MVMDRIAFPIARTRILLAAALCLVAVAAAKAEEGTPEQRAACTPDALRLCSSEIPDVARVTACMKAKQASLSARCRAAFLGPTATEVASTRRVIPTPHRRVGSPVVYSYASVTHHRAPLPHHRWARSDRMMRIAGQVLAGFNQACGSQALPADICASTGRFLSPELLSSFVQ